jgi:carbohydrate-selective porin OprB
VLSLVRLWQQHGQREAVRALLAPLYARCTEGLDTPDLQYIFRPSGSSAISNALVLGVQLAMTL